MDLTSSRPDEPGAGAGTRDTAGTLEGLPRRLALTLPELRYLADRAGGAPLPFDLPTPERAATTDLLAGRLGSTPAADEERSYREALSRLHDPEESLVKRGLVVDGVADVGVVGAIGLLATPTLAVDLDVVVDGARAKAWHRHSGQAVAALSTADGIVFELAYFEASQWAGELAWVAAVPEDVELGRSALPDVVDLPWELLDGCGEARRAQRTDVLPVIAATHTGQVRDGLGRPLPDADVLAAVTALFEETRGRLRALAADVSADGLPSVGVVSWVLVRDGWRALRARQADDVHRVELRRVDPQDLAAQLAPLLMEVSA